MPVRIRQISLVVGIALVAFVAGAWLVEDPSAPEAPVAASVSPAASPVSTEEPIEIRPEMEPYDYAPAPPQEPSPVDGFYMRVFTIEEMGGHSLAMPFHCLRCVPYSVDAGVQTLLLHEGRFFLEHQINEYRALGHFLVRGDRIVFYNDVNCSRTRGTYTWQLEHRELELDVVNDSCPYVDERSNDLTLAPWTKIDACYTGIKHWYPALVGC